MAKPRNKNSCAALFFWELSWYDFCDTRFETANYFPIMPLQSIAKTLIVLGIVLVIGGVLLWLGARAGLGSLPGDFSWRKGNTAIYIPIVTSIVLSILLTVVLNFLMRFFR